MYSVISEIKTFNETQNDNPQHSFMSDLKDAVTEISGLYLHSITALIIEWLFVADAEFGFTSLLLVGSISSNLFYLVWSSLAPAPRSPLCLVMAVTEVSMAVTSLVLHLTHPGSQGGIMLAFCLRLGFQAI